MLLIIIINSKTTFYRIHPGSVPSANLYHDINKNIKQKLKKRKSEESVNSNLLNQR